MPTCIVIESVFAHHATIHAPSAFDENINRKHSM